MKTLLATKTYLPSKPASLVTRPRLLTLLDTGLSAHHRLTLICALPGSGKSTLLSDWAHDLKGPVTWLSLDSEDNDVYRFWAYVLHAIQARFPQACESLLKYLSSAPPAAMDDFLPTLINTLAQLTLCEQSSPFVIILDDYHVIENQAIHESLTFFVDHLPPDIQLVIATRTDPPFPVHRWRARNQLVELRSADLRFTVDEAEKFLNEVMRLHLLPEQILQLGTRTEGWAVGLHLAALSLRGREDASAFIQHFSGSQHFVLEYLTNEVISQQPPDVQEFLLQTSILEKMCPELCDAIRDDETESSHILEYLDHSNIFLIPLDEERQWYRYHHLFAELLQIHLARQGQDKIHSLHQRAAEWFAAQGEIDEALQHALAAGNTKYAADLVIRNWLQVGFSGRVRTALNWIELLPKDIVTAHPLLSAANAWLLYLGGLRESVGEHVAHTYQALAAWNAQGYVPDDDYDYSALPAEMAVLEANLAIRKGDFQKGMKAAQEALRVAPPEKAQVQGIAWIAFASARRELGHFSEAIRAYHQAIRWNQASGNHIAAAMTTRHLSRLYQVQGCLQDADELIRSVLEQAAQAHQSDLPAFGIPYVVLGDLSYERNDLDQAQSRLEKGLKQGSSGGSLDLLVSSGILRAKLSRANGDLPGAMAAVEETYQAVHKMDEPLTEVEVRAWRARIRAASGNLQDASKWADTVTVRTTPGLGLIHGIELFCLARVLLALKRVKEAQALCQMLEKTAANTNNLGWESEALLLQAEALWMQSSPDRALDLLSQAVSIAEPRGFVRLFLDEGQLMGVMLKALSAKLDDPCRSGAARLLENFCENDLEKETVVYPASAATSAPLSDREIEVMTLMAAGLSNADIACRLVISMATVKTHISHIYDKLDVQNRAEAVARAKEKGLI